MAVQGRVEYVSRNEVLSIRESIEHRLEKVIEQNRTDNKELSLAINSLTIQFTRNNVIQEMLLKEFGELNGTVKKITESMSTSEAIKKIWRSIWSSRSALITFLFFFIALLAGFSEGFADFLHWLRLTIHNF